MAFYGKNFFTVIEFGTDKICVLHGFQDKAGNAEVLAFAQKSSDGAVLKGAIVDYNKALRVLSEVLAAADKLSPAGIEKKTLFYTVNGIGISSHLGEGTVFIYDGDRKVKEKDIREAVRNAQNLAFPPDRVNIGSYDSYFLIDDVQRVKNPFGQFAERLKAYVHIISAEKKRIDGVNNLFREIGYEHDGIPVFAGIASVYGAMSSDEREQGALLIDFGAGVCDYVLVREEGVLLSGVFPAGVSNLANDLSIALDLPLDFCKKFLAEGKLEEMRRAGLNFLEYQAPGGERARRIPLDSFEKVMDIRLREVFVSIRELLDARNLTPLIPGGVVLCGGAAKIPSALEILRDVFGTHVRVGEAVGVTGAMSAFSAAAPCYTTILGLLKYAIEYDGASSESGIGIVRDRIAGLTEQVFTRLGNLKKALKL